MTVLSTIIYLVVLGCVNNHMDGLLFLYLACTPNVRFTTILLKCDISCPHRLYTVPDTVTATADGWVP